jgi:hypothetical protein
MEGPEGLLQGLDRGEQLVEREGFPQEAGIAATTPLDHRLGQAIQHDHSRVCGARFGFDAAQQLCAIEA